MNFRMNGKSVAPLGWGLRFAVVFWTVALLSGAAFSQSFQAGLELPISSQTNPGPESIAVSDLDNDGVKDIITADNGFLTLFFGDGAGGFPRRATVPTRLSNATDEAAFDDNEFVLARDVTGDVLPDIIVANRFDPFTAITIFPNNLATPGEFVEPATRVTNGIGANPAAIAIGQFNPLTDPFVDLVVVGTENPKVRILFGDGRGNFTPGTTAGLSTSPSSAGESLDTGDFDKDGFLDLAVVDRQRVWVLCGNGLGGFPRCASRTSSTTPGAHLEFDVLLRDMDNDTNLDLVVANGGIFDSLSSTEHSVIVFFGDGDGGIAGSPTSIDVGGEVAKLAVSDFDNDGNLDIAAAVPEFANDTGEVVLIRGLGSRVFDSTGTISLAAMGRGTVAVAVEDLDNNGRPDVVLGNEGFFSGAPGNVPGNIVVYLSDLAALPTATPTLTPTLVPTLSASPSATATLPASPTPGPFQDPDINRDGFLNAEDLLILIEQQGNQVPLKADQ